MISMSFFTKLFF